MKSVGNPINLTEKKHLGDPSNEASSHSLSWTSSGKGYSKKNNSVEKSPHENNIGYNSTTSKDPVGT